MSEQEYCCGCRKIDDWRNFPFHYCSECKGHLVDDPRRENRKLKAEVKKLEGEMRLLLGAMLAAENALREARRRHEDFRGSEKQP